MSRSTLETKVLQNNLLADTDVFKDGIRATVEDLVNHGYVNPYDVDKMYMVFSKSGSFHINITGDRIFNDMDTQILVAYPDYLDSDDLDAIQEVSEVVEQEERINHENFMYYAIKHDDAFKRN